MVSTNEGKRIDADVKFPFKGIVRNDKSSCNCKCSWKANWNGYHCTADLEYRMLIIESLDKDTETRRLSPVAIASEGYVDLINGPQDHGWCLGYTCQERISTFSAIVALQKSYQLFFTSYNPHNTRLHLLNSQSNDALIIAVYYMKPQRIDVYRKGEKYCDS